MEKIKLSILYAEDEGLTRIYLSRCMERYGRVVQSVDGQDAFEKFQQEKFDLVVTDLAMPRMNGFDLIDKIRLINPDIPIIVTTAYRDDYKSIQGPLAFLEKPISLNLLYKKIELILTSSQ